MVAQIDDVLIKKTYLPNPISKSPNKNFVACLIMTGYNAHRLKQLLCS